MSVLAPLQGNRFSRRNQSSVITVPPPIEGWVSQNDPKSGNLTTARILRNIVPGRVFARSRNGCAKVADLPDNLPVESMITHQAGASRTLLAAVNGNLYSVDETPGDPVDTGTLVQGGFSNSRFQYINMSNAADVTKTIMVNGADGIWTYDEISGAVQVTPTPAIDDLLDVSDFKGRLWFTQAGTATVYYGDALSNSPATLTAFYLGPFLKKGGSVLSVNSISLDGGSGPDDYLVFVTDQGEILMFSGIDPGSDFKLIGTFKTSKPVGVRCLVKMGSDLMYYGTQGPEALGKLLNGLGRVDVLGVNIQDEFERSIKSSLNAHGFEMLLDTSNSWIICNVPVIAPSTMHQYVLNLENNSWFEITGWNANSWVQHGDEIYYGDNLGNVYIASYGLEDDGKKIELDWMSNWNEFGDPRLKKFNMAKITIRSIAKPAPEIDMMVDYQEKTPVSVTGFPKPAVESFWDVAIWNVSLWSSSPVFNTNIFGLNDYGYVGAFRYRENVKDSFTEIYGYQLILELGEIL